MSDSKESRQRIDRPLWNVLSTNGDPVEQRVQVTAGAVDVEAADGSATTTVYLRDDGVDVRVGDLQLIVKKRRVALVQQHPPYPISEWTILWEGEMA